jgi:phospholipid/cholesterol/gamma-HCH transport system substrate-binding protein
MFSASSAQKTKLGLLLVAAGGVLALVLFLFAGLPLVDETDRYYARTGESVSGLRVGASVEVHGVVAGRVAAIELERGRADPVILSLDVDAGTPIPSGASAVLRMRGVTGLSYVDIDGGDFAGATLLPGDTIPTRPSAMSEITDQGAALVEESRALVGSGKQVADRLGGLLDSENSARVEQILARGQRAVGHLDEAAVQVARTSARLDRLVAGEGRDSLEAAGDLVGDARRMVQASRRPIAGALADLREAARSLRHLAESLERDPSRLLFRRREKERP